MIEDTKSVSICFGYDFRRISLFHNGISMSLNSFFSSDYRGRTLLLSRLISIRDVSMNNYGKSSFARLNRGVVVLKSFIALIKNLMNNVNDVRKRRKMCIRTHNRSDLNNSSSLRDLFLAIVSCFHERSPGSVCREIPRPISRLFSRTSHRV